MSENLRKINGYFKDLCKSEEFFIVFLDTDDMIYNAKEMIDLAEDKVSMRAWGLKREVNKEEAKEYISKFDEEDADPRGIQFDDNGIKWILKIGRYLLMDNSGSANLAESIDVMSLYSQMTAAK